MKSITRIMANAMVKNAMTKKRRAVSAIVGIMLGLGLTAVAAGGLYVMTSDLSDSAVSISSVEIQNVRAYNTGDEAYMSMSVKNTGTDATGTLNVVMLLDCNGEDGAVGLTNRGTNPELESCDASATTSGVTTVKPGAHKSFSVGTISGLAPGATASISGVVEIYASTSLAATLVKDSAKLSLGEEYLLEIEGQTASGQPIIQTAEVRPR